jgi:hypothetical protein
MSLGQEHFVVCPLCNADLRAESLWAHYRRIHGKEISAEQLAAVISKMTNQPRVNEIAEKQQKKKLEARIQKVRSSEKQTDEFVAGFARKPHKCATTNCQNQITSNEEFCDACKTNTITLGLSLNSASNLQGGCRTCGRPTVPGENYCYECLGD